ncbi:MAG: molybdopterin converting factor subunit 1 [Chloroflexi bacterium]|nr:molybdopterin converting factor subunit 1 [Chloroflexota bacterium]
MMKVKLKLFATYREKVGQSELELSVPEGSTAGGVLARLVADYPALAGLAGATMFAVDQEFAAADAVLYDGQELALLPPVSGG